MIKTVLFDLDDTLLENDMDRFLPPYFALCGEFGQQYLPGDEFIRALLTASRAMVKNVDPTTTNNEVFWARFIELTGLDHELVEEGFKNFYRQEFEQLREVTRRTPLAAQVVQWCFDQNLDVVIATNPMFPRRAVEARLSWAGVPVSKYPYALVTTIENMHATKPNQAYYRQILDSVGCRADEALMVGDSGRNDIEPAVNLGLFTYWIQLPEAELPDGVKPTAQGTLKELVDRLSDGWLSALELENSG
jgi:HAD superfamily hydrolase (TIGR01549 family)